ncbi:MAG TPA: hypothetical protein VFQ30_16220 [Ktedonobacteraceae bacterium]|nr:hypothetical protein [Ktedonobacteraceae bacterium]
MPAPIQIDSTGLTMIPLLYIQHKETLRSYLKGIHYQIRSGHGPYPIQEWVCRLQWAAHTDFFDQGSKADVYQLIGYLLGFTHGGILTPERTVRPDMTTLIAFDDNQDAISGYKAGRYWFFEEANTDEHTMTDEQLIERLREMTKEAPNWHDPKGVWFFTMGCLLGELSGHLFPATTEEREEWAAERLKFIKEYNQQADQEHYPEPLPVISLQET